MKNKPIFMSSLLLFIVWLIVAEITIRAGFCQVLFQSDFENVYDWEQSRPAKNTSGYNWPHTWKDNNNGNPQYPPPRKFDGTFLYDMFRVSPTLFDPPNVTNMAEIKNGYGRGGGKGLLYNVEVSGTYGTWTGGNPMNVWLGGSQSSPTSHPELYMRFYLKYSPNWVWTDDSNPINNRGSMQKVMKFVRYNGYLGDGGNPMLYVAPVNGGRNHPLWSMQWYQYISVTPSYNIYYNLDRLSPDYSGNEGPYTGGFLWPTDANWHCYEFRAKMNSAPGFADGIEEVWLDGVLKFSKQKVLFVKSDGSVATGWNMVEILDNVTIPAHPLSSQVTYPLYVDDVVVTTHYSGPPPQPVSVTASGASETSVKLRWAAGTNGATSLLNGYHIYYGTDNNNLTSKIDVGIVTEHDVTELARDTMYYFAVSAFNKDPNEANENESLRSADVIAVTVDAVPPVLTLSPVTAMTNLASQTLSGTVSDAGAPATLNGNTWSYVIPSLVNGDNSLTITAEDLSGNRSSVTSSILLDTVAPAVTISPITSPTLSSWQIINGTVSDAVAGIASLSIKIGNGIPQPVTFSGNVWSHRIADLPVTPSSATTITLTALDAAGNLSQPASAPIQRLLACDINGDSTVAIEDALFAMQMGVGLASPSENQLRVGDIAPIVNGVSRPDGVINTGDAVVILGIIAGTLAL